MAVDQIAVTLPKKVWKEGSAFTATVNCRQRSDASAATPTSFKWRLDCLTTRKEIADWTTASAASSVAIAITGAMNAIQDDCNDVERKQLTIMTDDGLSTQHRQSVTWTVENLFGSP